MTLSVSTNSSGTFAYDVDSIETQPNEKPAIQQATEQAAFSALESLRTPATGSIAGCASFGMVGGTVAGFACGALANVAIWGTGVGLWVNAGDNEGMLIAGKVLTFVGIGSTALMTLIGCCVGLCTGGLIGEANKD